MTANINPVTPLVGGVPVSDANPLPISGVVDTAALQALLTTLNGYVDGLETLLGTSNSSLASILTALTSTIAGYVDGLETLVTSSNTKLDTIHTDLGTTLSGLLTDLKGYTDQLEGYVDGLEALVTSTNTKLDSVITALGAATPAGTNTIGATLDAGPSWTSVWGVAGVPFASADQHSAVASVTDAPTSGQKLCIDDIILSVDTAMSVTFKEETSGTIMFGPWYLPANGTVQVTLRGKKKLPTANKKLQIITSVAGNVNCQVGYHGEA